jgi:hypothetical protein
VPGGRPAILVDSDQELRARANSLLSSLKRHSVQPARQFGEQRAISAQPTPHRLTSRPGNGPRWKIARTLVLRPQPKRRGSAGGSRRSLTLQPNRGSRNPRNSRRHGADGDPAMTRIAASRDASGRKAAGRHEQRAGILHCRCPIGDAAHLLPAPR